MNQQVTPIQQVGSQLKTGGRYYHGLPSTYELFSYYVYDGVIDGEHQFLIPGPFENTMSRILIKPEDLEVKADKRIIFNSYKSNGVSKAEDSIEYQRLENLWGSKVR